jgi:predicted Fe-Mo cluster-binding NifX family protein
MKIGVTADNACVSTVFDFSGWLSLFDINEGMICRLREISLDMGIVSLRVAQLRSLKIDTLICGAISEAAAMMIRHSGMRLITGITGNVHLVVEAYIKNDLDQPCFLLPGFESFRESVKLR